MPPPAVPAPIPASGLAGGLAVPEAVSEAEGLAVPMLRLVVATPVGVGSSGVPVGLAVPMPALLRCPKAVLLHETLGGAPRERKADGDSELGEPLLLAVALGVAAIAVPIPLALSE